VSRGCDGSPIDPDERRRHEAESGLEREPEEKIRVSRNNERFVEASELLQ
jgi:hypothetical protein